MIQLKLKLKRLVVQQKDSIQAAAGDIGGDDEIRRATATNKSSIINLCSRLEFD